MTSSVTSKATQVSPEVGGTGLCSTTRTRSRSLNDLPGGLRVSVLKRPERLKPRIQATLAGLEELRLLKEQHRNLIDEAKLALRPRSASNSDVQDLYAKQTYEWLTSCRDRLSVSNLERISEESGKEEKNATTFEHSRLDRKFSDPNQPTCHRPKIKRPVSVSGYPTLEQSRKPMECYPDYKPIRQQVLRTTQSENKKPVQPEKFSTMRRASFQCHAVLTRQKDKIPTFSASHEYPSPMHAVMRQYRPKIGDDKLKNGKIEPGNLNLTTNRQSESIGNAAGVTVMRRSSFTVRSPSWSCDSTSSINANSSLTRYKSNQEIAPLYKNIDSLSRGSMFREEPPKKHLNKTNKTDIKGSISYKESLRGVRRESGILKRECSDQKSDKESKAETVGDTNQAFPRTQSATGVNENLNPIKKHHQQQMQADNSTSKKLFEKSPSNYEKYSEYQNLIELERSEIYKKEPILGKDTKPSDNKQGRSSKHVSRTEKNKNLLNCLKAETFSRTQSATGVNENLNPINKQQQQQQQQQKQADNLMGKKVFEKSPSKSEKYSEYQNLIELERGEIYKKETTPNKDTKPTDNKHDRSSKNVSRTEKNKNLLNHLKGDTCSYTSDEGYCASLSSIPSGRRQLSIQSDVSWISADIDDSRSCDSRVALSDDREGNSDHIVSHSAHGHKVDRKPSFSRCQNNIMASQNEALRSSKVLPFRQTSL